MTAEAIFRKNAQAATEYIMIAGFVFFAMLVAMTLLSKYGSDTFNDITDEQVYQICLDVVDMAESVHFMGFPARQTLEISMPEGIRNVTIERNDPAGGCTLCTELRFHVVRGGIPQYISCTTNIVINSSNLNRARTSGIKRIRGEAGTQGNVWVNWTS